MSLEFTDANFQQSVLQSDKLTVVDCWAEWCPPCRAISPMIDELAQQYRGKVNIGKINIDHNPNTSIAYGITAIPVILFIKNGKVVDKQLGAAPKMVLDRKIRAHL